MWISGAKTHTNAESRVVKLSAYNVRPIRVTRSEIRSYANPETQPGNPIHRVSRLGSISATEACNTLFFEQPRDEFNVPPERAFYNNTQRNSTSKREEGDPATKHLGCYLTKSVKKAYEMDSEAEDMELLTLVDSSESPKTFPPKKVRPSGAIGNPQATF
ncbi:hypothetical protein L596_020680 [Steinernema carpocapsae]|uniref:Uncharacterized protein n=1 Tax=Steinernema carpocapsae TaxID=34508 RepID=A0A4U5MV12_STECR|nr:hypothetical protein L596_020680 [Steinernema carpocapsae]